MDGTKAAARNVFLIVTVYDDIEVSSSLWNPVNSTVKTNRVADIVVLKKVDPRQSTGEDDVKLCAGESRNKFSLREINVIETE